MINSSVCVFCQVISSSAPKCERGLGSSLFLSNLDHWHLAIARQSLVIVTMSPDSRAEHYVFVRCWIQSSQGCTVYLMYGFSGGFCSLSYSRPPRSGGVRDKRGTRRFICGRRFSTQIEAVHPFRRCHTIGASGSCGSRCSFGVALYSELPQHC